MWKPTLAIALGMAVALGCDDAGNGGGETGRADRAEPMTPQERETTRGHAPGHETQAAADADFLREASHMNHAEIAAGRLAAERAENADVKQYGQHLVDDHTKAQQELQTTAQRLNVTLPNEPDEEHRRKTEQLREKSGAEFDKAFMRLMVEDHRKAVSKFETASKQAKDETVRAYAAKALPDLQGHLQQARDLGQKVGAPTAD